MYMPITREGVERAQDALDRRYLKGEVTEGEYEAACFALELRDRELARREVAQWRH